LRRFIFVPDCLPGARPSTWDRDLLAEPRASFSLSDAAPVDDRLRKEADRQRTSAEVAECN
jgi:hypothetical protein